MNMPTALIVSIGVEYSRMLVVTWLSYWYCFSQISALNWRFGQYDRILILMLPASPLKKQNVHMYAIFTCAEKLTASQLNLPHVTKKRNKK